MSKLVSTTMIVPNIHLLTVEAPAVVRNVKPGQFVILRAEDEGERIPLSVADWDAESGTVSVCVMNVGRTTDILTSLEAGSEIPTVVGPLGNASEIKRFGTVLCLAGCYGIGSIYPIARALKEKGNTVITVLEARSSYLFYWEDKFMPLPMNSFTSPVTEPRAIGVTWEGSRNSFGHWQSPWTRS